VSISDGGGILVAGSRDDLAWVAMFDPAGSIKWEKKLGEKNCQFKAAGRVKDGYIAVGYYDFDKVIGKFSETGELEWERKVQPYGCSEFNAFAPTADGGFVVVGGVTWDCCDSIEIHIFKYDQIGTERWRRNLGQPCGVGQEVLAAKDGGYLVAGGSDACFEVPAVIKVDENGVPQWEKSYLEVFRVAASAAVELESGRYIAPVSDWEGNVHLLEYDGKGNELRRIKLDGVEKARVLALERSKDGGWLAAGYKEAGDALSGWIVKLDEQFKR